MQIVIPNCNPRTIRKLKKSEIAGLKKEVVLVGELKLFEIWDKEQWEEEFERSKTSFLDASQSLSELGI